MNIRRKRFLLILIILAAALAFPVTVHSRTKFTCVLCRSERTDHSTFGYKWQSFRSNAMTDWFLEQRGEHSHHWARTSCTRSQNALGMTTKWACGSYHPIDRLPIEIQLRFHETVEQSATVAFFDAMTSDDADLQQKTITGAWEHDD
jgi:hypothetical protein